ncbi:hypothetical protein [Cetobacterium somerae]|uniref:hypothetical protein n=1 Tax=Cetobacterium somerae TaxID=188913 RepID=UPI00389129FB
MKKIILVMTSLLLVSSLALAVEEENTMNTNEAVAESAAPAGTLSKGESFMVAFGMQESPIVGGGESGGSTASTAATAVATTSAHTGAVVLTSSQNTPYSYK